MKNSYDENLNENKFFKILKTEYEAVFRRAIHENWTICIPCSESLHNYVLNEWNIFTHLLIPNDELPETHFFTLNVEEVRIFNNLVKYKDSVGIPILFTEIFYAEQVRYNVLCLERPLNLCNDTKNTNPRIYLVKTLDECVDLLTRESTNESALKKLDDIINQFLYLSNKNFFSKSLEQQAVFIRAIYNRCLKVILQDEKINCNVKASRMFMDNIKIAVESYLLHSIYSIIMKGLISNRTAEIGLFNKALRNFSTVQLKDLKVTHSTMTRISPSRNELSRFTSYTTVLEKLNCLKKSINLISNKKLKNLPIDDLLPILVFLVIKSGVTTWVAQLDFIKAFNFSQFDWNEANESSFLAATLEAVLTFIRSGLFIKMTQIKENDLRLMELDNNENNTCKYICRKSKLFWKTKPSLLLTAFEFIFDDNLIELTNILDNSIIDDSIFIELQCCHPLCSCDRCDKLRKINQPYKLLKVNSVNDYGFTPLHVAACYGRSVIVDWLLNHGADPNKLDFSGSTPLHCAAAHGNQSVVLLLMYASVKLNKQDDDYNQALHLASMNGHVDCVKALLYFAEHAGLHLDVNAVNRDGDTPLHLAVKYYYEEIVSILLNYNANPSIKNKHGISVFELTESLSIRALLTDKYPFVVNLMNNPAWMSFPAINDMPSWDSYNESRLLSKHEFGVQPESSRCVINSDKFFRAVRENDIETVKRVLGFDIYDTVRNTERKSNVLISKCHPLCLCEKCIKSTYVEEKNSNNFRKIDVVNVNICNCDGFTALHFASKYGRLEIMEFLLDVGAKINARSYKELLTPLHVACMSNQPAAVKILLDCSSCKINMYDHNGNTALHYACITANTRMVELLLKYKPDVNIRNNKGKTTINESEEKLSYTIMRMLKKKKSAVKNEVLT
ncbi:hypothetical protein PGB90_010560 [Kerria lacca]